MIVHGAVSARPGPVAVRASAQVAADPVLFPDLLHPIAMRRIDVEGTKLGVALAFAAGVSGGLFADALDRATIAPSTWDPSSFANDLFLRDFVTKCLEIRVDGHARPAHVNHLVKVLAQPPSDLATVHYRRAIVAELVESPVLRGELEKLYTSLTRLRALLEGASGAGKWDPSRRHLDILAVVKEVFDRTAEGFATARSGLASLAAFGRRVRDGEPYRSLADLLRYDDRLATLDLKVNVGADGRIRGFDIVSVQEDARNPFVVSPWRRWLAKVELFLRGFKFSDGEVMARLVDAVFEGIADELVPLVQLLGDIELYLGALGLYDRAKAAGLTMSLPELTNSGAPRRLEGLFNPLLLVHGVKPVPCTVDTDSMTSIVLVTGPNSGGKTRLLQSLGLAQLLAQSGLLVPARDASMSLAPGLVMSLIEEARADQSEGRLGTELVRIRALFEKLPPGAVVILDELCSGTNPSEGEEIFELVVQMLSRLEPQAFITTHFLTFAGRLERERKIAELRFLQVELGKEQRPTYQFVPGVASTSLAGHAAARLGVTRDELLGLIDRNTARAKG
ncbi:MAG: DNA mismatch repair protein [Deltaproteobacteria bacterium]|nr:DNA mismatch repair protein [Deltaproteobacteria bacterium]